MNEKSNDMDKLLIDADKIFSGGEHSDEAKEFFFSILGNAPFGVMVIDNDNKIVVTNTEVLEIFSKDINKEDIIGKTIESFMEILPGVLETIKYTQNNKNDYFDMATVSYRNKFLSIKGRVFPKGMIIFYDNVTELRQDETVLKEKLKEQRKIDKMKTEFVSIASHQLRTPLGSIKLFAEVLKSGELGDLNDKQKSYIEDIHESSQRMVSLVNNLLNVSRLESGKLEVMPQLTDLGELVNELILESIPVSDIEKCHITFNKPEEEFGKVMVDPTFIKQVVYNLIINASRYSHPDECQVNINLTKGEHDDYVLSVSDSGIGIPIEDQPRIFEKFFRATDATRLITEGTGIGLYISKMIVEVSGGKIWFESKGKDQGSTFFVSFPVTGTGKKTS